MNQYLFLFSIGPVQSFIAQARKPQDFAAGSWILSELIDLSMQDLPRESIIFPAPDIENKPNRFIAAITTDTPHKFGEAVEAKVRQKFRDMADISYQTCSEILRKPPEGYAEQIEGFLDIHWVMLPYERVEAYGEIYMRLEQMLGASKNLRAFEQAHGSERGRKCAMDGEHNIKIYRKSWEERRDENQQLYQRKLFSESAIMVEYAAGKHGIGYKDLQPGEGLSAISLLKRKGTNELKINSDINQYGKMFRYLGSDGFPSTAAIALMKTIYDGIKESETKDYFDQFRDCFGDHHFDAQLYYEENLTEEYLRKYGFLTNSMDMQTIQTRHEALRKCLSLSRKYYALIRFDGDDMGKWLSGQFLTIESDLFEFHRVLSRQLGAFAREARKIVNEHCGQTVYAGGDDFLGFLNLAHLFEVLRDLRSTFRRLVQDKIFTDTCNFTRVDQQQELTLSAGVVIAHYKMPLSSVIQWSKTIEERAKNFKNGQQHKNAIGIAVMPHSGNIRMMVFPWQPLCLDPDPSKTPIFSNVVKALALPERKFSENFITMLDSELRHLCDEKGMWKDSSVTNDMVKIEIERLLRRAKAQGIPDADIETMAQYVYCIYEDCKHEDTRHVENFLSALHIAAFMAREGQ